MILFPLSVLSQKQQSVDYFHDDAGNTYHQLYLDFHADEILDIHYQYNDTDKEIEGELSVDGYSIIIKNYLGTSSVYVKLKTSDGDIKEVTRSKCHIDPVMLVL